MPLTGCSTRTSFNSTTALSAPPPDRFIEEQDRWRRLIEANPTGFVLESLEPALDDARTRLCALVGADPADLVFVMNATMGVNTVVRSLALNLATSC